jgi:hypothetical protein
VSPCQQGCLCKQRFHQQVFLCGIEPAPTYQQEGDCAVQVSVLGECRDDQPAVVVRHGRFVDVLTLAVRQGFALIEVIECSDGCVFDGGEYLAPTGTATGELSGM